MENNIWNIVQETVSEVQDALYSEINSWNLVGSGVSLDKIVQDEKQKVSDIFELKKQELTSWIKESIKIYIWDKIDSFFWK